MNQFEQFKETITEIANAFSFQNIQLDELEKYYKLEVQNVDPFNKKRISALLFLNNYSEETAIMLKFANLYMKTQQARAHTTNSKIGFLVESGELPRVYTTLETLVEYLTNYRKLGIDVEVFLKHIKSIELVELI